MQVILKKDIPSLGRIGQVVQVPAGYARNFLIPRAIAVAADSKNVAQIEHQKRLVESIRKKVTKESQERAEKLKGATVKLERRANEQGKLFGALQAADLAPELKAIGFDVDRRDIIVEAIREGGDFVAQVRLPGDVLVNVNVKVSALIESQDKAESKKTKAKKAPRAKKAAAEEEAETAETPAE